MASSIAVYWNRLTVLPRLGEQLQEGHVDLDAMAGDLFLVSVRVHRTPPDVAGQPIHPVPPTDAIDSCIGDPDAVIPLHVPDDSFRAEMVCAAQVKHLLDHLRSDRIPIGHAHWLLASESCSASNSVFPLPDVEQRPGDPEIPAGPTNVSILLGVLEHP